MVAALNGCHGNVLFLTQVLYVPDQDELAKLAPPIVVPEAPVTSSVSSVDSEATPTITTTELEDGNRPEGETEAEGAGPGSEVADDHISILSKHISEDQVRVVCCVLYH